MAPPKGFVPWNKGKIGIYKLSEETKRKISKKMKIIMKGKHTSPETEFKKGHGVPKEIRKKISLSEKGRKLSEEHKRKIIERLKTNHPRLGKKHTEESKEKIKNAKIKLYEKNFWLKTKISNSVKKLWQSPEYRQAHIGPNHFWWKGGLTKREETLAHALRVELRNWTKEILERDNYTCQKCGRRFEKIFLHAHHIKPISKYPSLALDALNGITLCKNCHLETESYGRKLRKRDRKLLKAERKQFVSEVVNSNLGF
jgi:predicted HNH restriction endonuclease